MPKIQDFINNKNKYRVDYNYQRPNDAWSNDDKQCLIDTILKDEPIPLFFMNYNPNENVYYIVDGQQRLHCITQFYKNELKLNKKYSGTENHGATFNGENALSDDLKSQFLNYELKFHVLDNYDDEKVRNIFSKLQRGKPLQLGERLNAKPGKIVETMRSVANHDFLQYSVAVAKNRYGIFPDAARIMFYEVQGAKQMGSKEIYEFFEKNKDLDHTSKSIRNVKNVLNFLSKCFPKEPGNYNYMEKHAWVLAVYTMVRDLKLRYSLIGEEENIQKFIKTFHSNIYNDMLRDSNTIYRRFYENIRGGWSEKIIVLRRDILIAEYLKKHPITELDDRRQISNEEKIAAFGMANHRCEMEDCDVEFKDYREAEYHHEDLYSHGGRSNIENIKVLCSDCHDKIHNKAIIVESQTNDIESVNEESNNSINIKQPIGTFVREKIQELISKNRLDESEVERLQSQSYSKLTFDVQYPILKMIDSSYNSKIERYWKTPIIIRGKRYVVCSEWYEQPNNNDRPYFLKWYMNINK
uniref:GmrSD restriction endonuclease domain-containing protein n=1 Tax=Gelidibacter sp. TaxID=2018083 RepID=UPI00404B8CE6